MPNTQTTVEYGRISQFLWQADINKSALFQNGFLEPYLGYKIYILWDTLNYLYTVSPSDSRVIPIKNYLYSLCGKYVQQSQVIIGDNGGQIINPPVGPSPFIIAIYLQFVVGEPLSPMNAGDTVLTITYDDILLNSISIMKDTVPLPIGLSNQQSFTVVYNAANAVITFNEPVADGQLFVVRGLRYFNT